MFDSGLSASDLIGQIKSEADIALPIPDESYISWLNALEQLLYTELIREQGKIELDGASVAGVSAEDAEVGDLSGFVAVIGIDTLDTPNGENAVRFEDVHAVYADKTQLIKSTVASGVIFPNTYYKIGNDIGVNLKKQPEKVKIIYFVKPELKTTDNIGTKNVMIPAEFIDLVKAKLRGEAYKIANEGELAAVWINDYNVLLETFKAWLSGKQSEFGI